MRREKRMGDERVGRWMGEKDGRLERKMGETNDGCERKTVWGRNSESCGYEDVGSYINDEYQSNARGERDRQADRQTGKRIDRDTQ